MTAPTDVRVPGQRVGSEIVSRLEVIPDVEPDSEEWHTLRRGIVTASAIDNLITSRAMGAGEYSCPACDAPAGEPCRSKVKRAGERGAPIKTVHPERTTLAASMRADAPRIIEAAPSVEVRGLTALLAAERITGFTEPTYFNDEMLRGHEDEPRAVDAYAQHYRTEVDDCGFMIRSWGRCRLGYSPDGVVGDDGLLEVKSRRQKKHLLTVIADEVPNENMAQLQAALFVSGRQWIDYISYCGGMNLWTKRVFPEERWFGAITAAVEAFESAADEMAAKYKRGVEGMPMTERVDLEMIL